MLAMVASMTTTTDSGLFLPWFSGTAHMDIMTITNSTSPDALVSTSPLMRASTALVCMPPDQPEIMCPKNGKHPLSFMSNFVTSCKNVRELVSAKVTSWLPHLWRPAADSEIEPAPIEEEESMIDPHAALRTAIMEVRVESGMMATFIHELCCHP